MPPVIHEEATLTSKGQLTLPKSIRQALGVDAGGKVAFDLNGSQVVVYRVEDSAGHRDPAIEGFLSLLETDIRSGQNLTSLPQALERSMMNASKRQVDLDDEIEGDVSL
ncbi:MAG: hypothetical protein RI968_853 [Pseudomonadota bacterium]|jgi:antitoxin PrlF